MKQFIKTYRRELLWALVCTIVLLLPYLSRNFLPIEHDTFFHLSRIEGMAASIRNGQFLPAIYPMKNNGYGYASPLFYCDILLIPAAILYLLTGSISISYIVTVFVMSYASLAAFGITARRITKRTDVSFTAITASAFANYRITNIYVRGALGEICAMAFLPILVYGLYQVLYEEEKDGRIAVCIGLCGLVCSHNLSFLFGVILTVIFFLLRVMHVQKESIRHLFEGIIAAFFLTAFFTLPMIEQLRSQQFYVHVTGSDLASYTMQPWQYFANTTVFGYGNNTYAKDQIMTVNPGWFLMAAPLLMHWRKETAEERFLQDCRIFGYIFLILPCSLIPWSYLGFASIVQFPWRLIMVSMTLLVLPAAVSIADLLKRRVLVLAMSLALCAEGIWHILPVYERTFGITAATPYSALIDGTVIDPYYSAFYVRTELAGADYLPVGSPDFREREAKIYCEDGPLDIELRRMSTSSLFVLDEPHDLIELPITWYQGYTMWHKDALGDFRIIPSGPSSQRLVSIHTAEKGSYMLMYQNTAVQTLARQASMLALVVILFGKRLPTFQKLFKK